MIIIFFPRGYRFLLRLSFPWVALAFSGVVKSLSPVVIAFLRRYRSCVFIALSRGYRFLAW